MKFQSLITHLFVIFSIVSSYGCAHLLDFSAAQEWSENYALAKGVQANDPAIIDGNVETVGRSQYIQSSSDTVSSFASESESVITLPEPKPIHRVVIHSANLEGFDLWVMDAQGRWERIKEVKGNKKPIMDVRFNQTVNTAGVRIRVRRTTDDDEMRRKNVRAVRGGYRVFTGKTHALAQIAEVELYGFVPKRDAVDAPPQKTKDGKPLDTLLKF